MSLTIVECVAHGADRLALINALMESASTKDMPASDIGKDGGRRYVGIPTKSNISKETELYERYVSDPPVLVKTAYCTGGTIAMYRTDNNKVWLSTQCITFTPWESLKALNEVGIFLMRDGSTFRYDNKKHGCPEVSGMSI